MLALGFLRIVDVSAETAQPVPEAKALPTPQALPLPKPIADISRPALSAGDGLPASPAEPGTAGSNTRPTSLPSFRTYVAPDSQVPTQASPVADIQETTLTLTIDDSPAEDIAVQTNTALTRIFFDTQALLARLARAMLRDKFIRHIHRELKGRRWVDVDELRKIGFTVTVHTGNFSALLLSPPAHKKTKKWKINQRLGKEQAIDLWPAPTSASLSAYWDRIAADQVIAREAVLLEGRVVRNNWVLENDQTYNVLLKQNTRRATTLTADFPREYVRFSAGDIAYRTVGLMGNAPLLGATLGTYLNMQPNLIYNPIIHQTIFLESAANVKIYLNNALYQQFSLPGGYYDLLDFPLTNGISNVMIEITDSGGHTRTYAYQGLNDMRVLSQGIRDFGITAGVPRARRIGGEPIYYKENPLVSGFLRQGYTPNVTLGLMGEGSKDYLALGGSATLLSYVGTVEFDAALGAEAHAITARDYALSADYVLAHPTTAFSVSLRYSSEHYRSLGQSPYTPQYKYNVAGSYSMPYVLGIRPLLRLRYSERWDGQRDDSLTLRVDKRITGTVAVGLEAYTHTTLASPARQQGVSVDFTWTPWRYMSSRAGYASAINEKQLSVSSSTGTEVGASATGTAAESDLSRSLAANAQIYTRALEYSYSGTETQVLPAHTLSRFERQALSRGIAYAGGTFAWGRALNKTSFVIVDNVDNAGDQTILVGRGTSGDKYVGMSGYSSQLFSNLGAYSVTPIFAKVKDDQAGYRLDRFSTNVYSTYLSGARLVLKGDVSVYGAGVLQDANGAPLGLLMAYAVRESDGYRVDFFTDETGLFQIEGLRTGRFHIVVENLEGTAVFDIAPTKAQAVELGAITYSVN